MGAAVLLHAGRPHPRWGFPRVLARPTLWFTHTADDRSRLAGSSAPAIAFTGNLWHDLRTLLNHRELPGAWVGYLSYDLARLIEPRKLRPPPATDWPLVELGYCPQLIEFPHANAAPQIENQKSKIKNPLSPRSDFSRPAYESAVRRVLDYIAGDATLWEQEPLQELAADGELMAWQHTGFWQPMDTLRDKALLEELWASGRAPWKTWA